MADPGLIIAFAHGLLLLQPSVGLSLALLRVKVQKFSPLLIVPVETGKSVLRGLLATKVQCQERCSSWAFKGNNKHQMNYAVG